MSEPAGDARGGGRGLGRPLLLFRIDDRLLHGQVALGWGRRLHPAGYLLADDELASDPASAAFYQLVAPPGVEVGICAVDDTPRSLAELHDAHGAERIVLLVRNLTGARRLVALGLPGPINLGGLHSRAGAQEVLRYVFLTDDDRHDLAELVRAGITVTAQDLPESDPVAVTPWLTSLS